MGEQWTSRQDGEPRSRRFFRGDEQEFCVIADPEVAGRIANALNSAESLRRAEELLRDCHEVMHRTVAEFVPSNDGAYNHLTDLMERIRELHNFDETEDWYAKHGEKFGTAASNPEGE